MNILHISNDYCGSKVYCNLTKELDDMDVNQVVYCPVRAADRIGKNQFEGKHIQFVYSFCMFLV